MSEIKSVYFIGIGGIGMSAIARYYNHEGYKVGGYDRVSTILTRSLESEGIAIHYDDDITLADKDFLDKNSCMVIYTPAIPKEHSELNYFLSNGFTLIKRSKALGVLTKDKFLIAVAGTHGKTSTSTMTAWMASLSKIEGENEFGGGSAFLGGISKNFNSNLVLGRGNCVTVEADEFDRSFLQLYPDIAIISSTDADHLDIYGNHDILKKTFAEFASQVKSGGTLIYKKGIDLSLPDRKDINIYTYSICDDKADFHASDITLRPDGLYNFNVVTPTCTIKDCTLGIPGLINVENCTAAIAALLTAGCNTDLLRGSIKSFKGVKRRFEVHINRPNKIYIDDYAHHPRELTATIESIRAIYKDKKITAIFQPHLYTRTRDFAAGFSKALSLADKVILLPIYPARELPIEGIESDIILKNITLKEKYLVLKDDLLKSVKDDKNEVIVTFGAGDIDLFCNPIRDLLNE
ncbi:MAG: UDP-N-acetylmuramate--L-alanine ligase [Rikenellaceae bacterium]